MASEVIGTDPVAVEPVKTQQDEVTTTTLTTEDMTTQVEATSTAPAPSASEPPAAEAPEQDGDESKKQVRVRKCFRCRQAGHLAESCPKVGLEWRDFKQRLWKGKRHVIALGYIGTNYHGISWEGGNYELRTIEGVLLQALHEAGIIPALPQKGEKTRVDLNRACRTDARVHAVCNYVSLSLPLPLREDPPGARLQRLNDALPPDIRAYAEFRVQGQFNFRIHCQSREYRYLLPEWVVLPKETNDDSAGASPMEGGGAADGETPVSPLSAGIERLNTILKKYEGSHPYHNFTDQRKSEIPSAWSSQAVRLIYSIKALPDVVVDEESQKRFVCIVVHGQSFITYQIRKMVGLAVCALRGHCSEETVDVGLGREWSFEVPAAPREYLHLHQPFFPQYNADPERTPGHAQFNERFPGLPGIHDGCDAMYTAVVREAARVWMDKDPFVVFFGSMPFHMWTKQAIPVPENKKKPVTTEPEGDGEPLEKRPKVDD